MTRTRGDEAPISHLISHPIHPPQSPLSPMWEKFPPRDAPIAIIHRVFSDRRAVLCGRGDWTPVHVGVLDKLARAVV